MRNPPCRGREGGAVSRLCIPWENRVNMCSTVAIRTVWTDMLCNSVTYVRYKVAFEYGISWFFFCFRASFGLFLTMALAKKGDNNTILCSAVLLVAVWKRRQHRCFSFSPFPSSFQPSFVGNRTSIAGMSPLSILFSKIQYHRSPQPHSTALLFSIRPKVVFLCSTIWGETYAFTGAAGRKVFSGQELALG